MSTRAASPIRSALAYVYLVQSTNLVHVVISTYLLVVIFGYYVLAILNVFPPTHSVTRWVFEALTIEQHLLLVVVIPFTALVLEIAASLGQRIYAERHYGPQHRYARATWFEIMSGDRPLPPVIAFLLMPLAAFWSMMTLFAEPVYFPLALGIFIVTFVLVISTATSRRAAIRRFEAEAGRSREPSPSTKMFERFKRW